MNTVRSRDADELYRLCLARDYPVTIAWLAGQLRRGTAYVHSLVSDDGRFSVDRDAKAVGFFLVHPIRRLAAQGDGGRG